MKNAKKPQSDCCSYGQTKNSNKRHSSCSFEQVKEKFLQIDYESLGYEDLLLYSTLHFLFKEEKVDSEVQRLAEEWVCNITNLHNNFKQEINEVKVKQIKRFLEIWWDKEKYVLSLPKRLKKKKEEKKLIKLVVKNLPEKILATERKLIFYCLQFLYIWRTKMKYF